MTNTIMTFISALIEAEKAAENTREDVPIYRMPNGGFVLKHRPGACLHTTIAPPHRAHMEILSNHDQDEDGLTFTRE